MNAAMMLLDPSQYATIHSTPILEAVTSKGGAKLWQGHVAQKDDRFFTYTTYCQVLGGKEMPEGDIDWSALQGTVLSKITVSEPTLIEAKNVGRSNETHPKAQAIFEIESTFKKQVDKGYFELGGERDTEAFTLPMLAYPYPDKEHTVEFPCVAQPKYDGVRCLSDGEKMWSRKGKQFDPKIVAHFFGEASSKKPANRQMSMSDFADAVAELHGKLDTLGYISDGELIMPEGTLLQDTVSAAKKFYPDLSPKLLYRIYDVVIPDKNYLERYEIVKQIVAASNHPQIIAAPVEIVNDEEELYVVHKKLVSQRWEGTMVRVLCTKPEYDREGNIKKPSAPNGYKAGLQRDQSLLKVKDFMEEEFLVVGVEEGKGKFKGAAIFNCVTTDGKEFNSTPVGTMEQRRSYFSNPQSVVGTYWTIRFQAYTKDGKPQFSRAINERDKDIQG